MNPEMYSEITSIDPNTILPVFVDVMLGLLAGAMVLSILQLVLQIMCNYSLYTIASRRGIRHPWMAFVPLVNLWLLDSIADQYQYVAQGEVHNRRKTLLGLGISIAVLAVVIYGLYVGVFAVMMREVMLPTALTGMDPSMIPLPKDILIGMGAGMGISALLIMVLSVILVIYQYICYYNVMESCRPKWSVVFIIFGILFTPLLYLFVFICRNKDGGMPPRKAAAQTAPVTVPQVQAAPVQTETEVPAAPVAETPAEEPVAEPALEEVAESVAEPALEAVAEPAAETVEEETAAVE